MTAVTYSRLAGILSAIVDPVNSSTLQYAGQGRSLVPTKSTTTLALDWTTAVAASYMPATDMQVFCTRDPMRAVIFLDHNVGALTYRYNIVHYNGTTSFPTVHVGVIAMNGRWALGVSAYLPHGPHLFPLEADGQQGWWVDKDPGSAKAATINVLLAWNPVSDTGSVNFWRYLGGWVVSGTTRFAAGTTLYTFTVASSGYYRAEVALDAASIAVPFPAVTYYIEAPAGTSPPTWCHRPLPNYLTLMEQARGIRVTAASMVLVPSATAAATDLIAPYEGPPAQDWVTVAAGRTALLARNGGFSGVVPLGLRTFLRPDDDVTFTLKDDIDVRGAYNEPVTSFYGLFPPSRSSFQSVALSVAVAAARTATVTIVHAMEYAPATYSTAIPRVPPLYSPEEWAYALWVLSCSDARDTYWSSSAQVSTIITVLMNRWRAITNIQLNY